MYSVEKLLDIAMTAEAEYHRLREIYPPGTINDARNGAYELSEKATLAAEWMEANGFKELPYVGSFGDPGIHPGDHVRIKAGAVIHSTYPGAPRCGIVSPRASTVQVRFFDRGGVHYVRQLNGENVIQPKITWAGSGGYWRWTDACNASKIED